MSAQVVAQLIPVSHELLADAAYFRGTYDSFWQQTWHAWRFGESTAPIMAAIEGTPARWDMDVYVEETVDWSWGE